MATKRIFPDDHSKGGKPSQVKKYTRMAHSSVLALSMGLGLTPLAAHAEGNAAVQPANNEILVNGSQQTLDSGTTTGSGQIYTGDSIAYFKNTFLNRTTFSLQSGEGHAPAAANLRITGIARVGSLLTGSYSYSDEDGDDEAGSAYAWYWANDSEGTDRALIEGADSQSYTPGSSLIGKYLFFEVTPADERNIGATELSQGYGPVSAAQQSAAVSSTHVTTTVSPAADEESLIEVVNVNKDQETSNAAKLTLSKNNGQIELADFNFLSGNVTAALEAAAPKETIAVRVKTLKDAEKVQGNIGGDVLAAMGSKTQRLAMITGDVAIDFPAVSIPVDELAKASQVSADQVKVEMSIEKQPDTVKEGFSTWAAGEGAAAVGSPYRFSIQVKAGESETSIDQYGDRYAYHTLPIPEGAGDPQTLGAVMLLDGKYVPVPVRVIDEEHAVVETPTNATIMLVQRDTSFEDLSGHWGANDMLFMANKGNMGGTSTAAFGPSETMTRGELASVLVNALGLGLRTAATAETAQFSDLPEDPSSAQDIELAAAAGLFQGLADGTFGTDQMVTREQLIAVLIRFNQNFELELPAVHTDDLSASYKDGANVSDWARQYVEAAQNGGILSGYQDVSLQATKAVTREEAAAIIRRFLERTNLTN
ncbi:S-layer homology domain-containing protein [Paenibacillus pinistramenti]|uniref:S-layer homology domain-containing protein n=1 Tax=Paenibacillus pinistramenti TaxID=1768003 RepID=UPI001108D383|nr:S-layer homology domain-containing protein [Paenibacillus pinistramenti]